MSKWLYWSKWLSWLKGFKPKAFRCKRKQMEDYRFKGLPLSPFVAGHLIKQFFAGKLVSRKVIVSTLESHHAEQGGIVVKKSTVSAIKKALQIMVANKECCHADVFGYWKIFDGSSTLVDLFEEVVNADVEYTDVDTENTNADVLILGEGKECVYMYWYPLYEQVAKNVQNAVWSCKIGYSKQCGEVRIKEQTTGMPEKPVVGLYLKTNRGASLETAIHSILKYKGQQVVASGGIEWFNTNPMQVIEIYKMINAM